MSQDTLDVTNEIMGALVIGPVVELVVLSNWERTIDIVHGRSDIWIVISAVA